MEKKNISTMCNELEKFINLLMVRGEGMNHCVLSWDEFNDAQKMLREVLSAMKHCESANRIFPIFQ